MANIVVPRQQYNVLGLAISPSPATGFMFTLGTAANPTSGLNMLRYIPRVQSAAIDLNVNAVDVNQYGQTPRLDNVILTAPDVQLSFDYLIVDGFAEALMGFAASGQQGLVSGFIDGTQSEKNYFLGVAPPGVDLIGSTTSSGNINVVAVGNGVVSNYSLTLAVGQIPRASVTVQGNNMQTYVGSTGLQSPAINPNTALQVVGPLFTLPAMPAYTGAGIATALRPGDIVLTLPRSGGFGDYTAGVGQLWVQGLSMSVPINLDPIMQLGNPFPISRPIQFPVNCTLTLDALEGDIAEDNSADFLCSYDPVNLQFQLKEPDCARNGPNGMTVWFNQAKLVNRSYNSSIGQNSTVRLTYSNQLGGISANYLTQGIVMSGSYSQTAPVPPG